MLLVCCLAHLIETNARPSWERNWGLQEGYNCVTISNTVSPRCITSNTLSPIIWRYRRIGDAVSFSYPFTIGQRWWCRHSVGLLEAGTGWCWVLVPTAGHSISCPMPCALAPPSFRFPRTGWRGVEVDGIGIRISSLESHRPLRVVGASGTC